MITVVVVYAHDHCGVRTSTLCDTVHNKEIYLMRIAVSEKSHQRYDNLWTKEVKLHRKWNCTESRISQSARNHIIQRNPLSLDLLFLRARNQYTHYQSHYLNHRCKVAPHAGGQYKNIQLIMIVCQQMICSISDGRYFAKFMEITFLTSVTLTFDLWPWPLMLN